MANKVTKRDIINAMMANEGIKAHEDWMAYLSHEIELLDKKSASKKPTKVQEANVGIKADIVAILTAEGKSLADIASESGHGDFTPQKTSSLLKQLEAEGLAVRLEGKKALYAKVAVGD